MFWFPTVTTFFYDVFHYVRPIVYTYYVRLFDYSIMSCLCFFIYYSFISLCSFCCCSVANSRQTLWNLMNCSLPDSPVLLPGKSHRRRSLVGYSPWGCRVGHNFTYTFKDAKKSRDIALLTKVHLVKAMVFPVVMYGYESWTIKIAECWRIDTFKL